MSHLLRLSVGIEVLTATGCDGESSVQSGKAIDLQWQLPVDLVLFEGIADAWAEVACPVHFWKFRL